MASSFALKLACVVLVCTAVGAPIAQASITCGQVTTQLAPCIAYLRGATLSQSCCSGVKNLNAAATSTPDRQTACQCLKSAAGSIPGINYDLAAALPSKCGVNIPYKISPSTDCKSVK